jgi:hypothetical protein
MPKLIPGALACICILSFGCALHAQPPYAPTATSCLKPFYDPANYNWYAYSNNCTDKLHVTWVSRDGNHSGTLDIRPERSANIGFDADEVSKMNGVEAYACPEHYYAVDAIDRNVTKPVAAFRCKYQGY